MTTEGLSVPVRFRPAPARWMWAVALMVGCVATYFLFRGRDVPEHAETAAAFTFFQDIRDWVDANRDTNAVFLYVVNQIRQEIGLLVGGVQAALRGLGWLGVVAVAGALGMLAGGWRKALLTVGGFLSLGVLGLWQESMDTLALTISAVALSLLIGIPLGIAVGRGPRMRAVVTPLLDVMQIMPVFAYLAPMALIFLIGEPSATIAVMIYAIPPAIRITALGISEVSRASVEAATSLGSTHGQLLRKVQLPLARRTILLGVNQTIMMALSMVVVTALIDAPGLGEVIVRSVERVNVGLAFDAGLAIVIMAIVLDRLTGWSSMAGRDEVGSARRRAVLVGTACSAVVVTAAGRLLPLGADFPAWLRLSFAPAVNAFVGWVESTMYPVTEASKNLLTAWMLNPLQSVLTTSPWWLVTFAVFGVGVLIGGVRAAMISALAFAAIVPLGLWRHGMETLATVLVAAVLTLVVGVSLGVLAAWHSRIAAIMRPLFDAAQTMPSFVYLLPAVALFGATRFTAIFASVVYAVPPVARLVCDGIQAVPATVREAATAAGSTPLQLLWKVQLPMARSSLLVAANQGIVMVLTMVVVGGLVGAGALGYDVVAGFAQSQYFGQGLAAGTAIVLLGIGLDRLTQGAGSRPQLSRKETPC